ncbi:MAG: AMP-binding protein [Alphaproteobacteria bacterium]|nr:AMP-binding protein [Alphaproteobacteria bacterium]
MSEQAYLDRLHGLWRKNWPKGIPTKPVYPFGEVLFTDYLRQWARKQPNKPAFIYYGAELTYGRLDEESDRFAAYLAANGAKKGDRVAVFLPNCPQFIVAFFGILKLGCIHVPVNPMFKEQELLYELNDTEAEIILAQDQLMPLVRAVKDRTKLRLVLSTSFADALPAKPTFPVPEGVRAAKIACPDTIDFTAALAATPAVCPKVAVGLDDVAALNYTGGTTGMPKGCVHTQRDMIYTAATTCTVALGTSPDDIGLCFYQVFWIAGEDLGLIFPIFSGATYVLLARWDAVGFMAAVERHKVNLTSMLVDNAVEIMEHADVGKYDLRSLRKVRVSSFVKKLNVDYRRRWHALTGAVMAEASWGMTETHTCDTFTTGFQEGDFDLKQKPIFVGVPVPGTDFKICDFQTGELLPLDQEGELCIRSPSLLKAYWNKKEASGEALKNGWLHTGDIGLIDGEGYIHFLGRRKEMLKVKGMSVFPAEIEALLGQHPDIIGSGVIGRPDPDKGQVPVAFIRVKPEAKAKLRTDDLVAWCRKNMATYKVPEIRVVDELPMTATGKVKKEELAKLL